MNEFQKNSKAFWYKFVNIGLLRLKFLRVNSLPN